MEKKTSEISPQFSRLLRVTRFSLPRKVIHEFICFFSTCTQFFKALRQTINKREQKGKRSFYEISSLKIEIRQKFKSVDAR